MEIISIIFWFALALLYLGAHFPYQEVLIGICALLIGLVQLSALIPRKPEG